MFDGSENGLSRAPNHLWLVLELIDRNDHRPNCSSCRHLCGSSCLESQNGSNSIYPSLLPKIIGILQSLAKNSKLSDYKRDPDPITSWHCGIIRTTFMLAPTTICRPNRCNICISGHITLTLSTSWQKKKRVTTETKGNYSIYYPYPSLTRQTASSLDPLRSKQHQNLRRAFWSWFKFVPQ